MLAAFVLFPHRLSHFRILPFPFLPLSPAILTENEKPERVEALRQSLMSIVTIFKQAPGRMGLAKQLLIPTLALRHNSRVSPIGVSIGNWGIANTGNGFFSYIALEWDSVTALINTVNTGSQRGFEG